MPAKKYKKLQLFQTIPQKSKNHKIPEKKNLKKGSWPAWARRYDWARSSRRSATSGRGSCTACWSGSLSRARWFLPSIYTYKHRYTLRGQSNVWRLPKYWPPAPSTPSECVTPRLWCGERTNSLGGKGWGSLVRKTPDTALYSTYICTVSTLCL